MSRAAVYSTRKELLTPFQLFLLEFLVPLDPVTFTRNKIFARLRLHYTGWSWRLRNTRSNATTRTTPLFCLSFSGIDHDKIIDMYHDWKYFYRPIYRLIWYFTRIKNITIEIKKKNVLLKIRIYNFKTPRDTLKFSHEMLAAINTCDHETPVNTIQTARAPIADWRWAANDREALRIRASSSDCQPRLTFTFHGRSYTQWLTHALRIITIHAENTYTYRSRRSHRLICCVLL